MVEYEHRPLGYVQFYPSLFWFFVHGDVPGEAPWGMDVFIGSPAERNQGLGARLVRQVALYLLRERGATRVIIDPEEANTPALMCYEKAGFRKDRFVPGSVVDDEVYPDTWLMEFDPGTALQQF